LIADPRTHPFRWHFTLMYPPGSTSTTHWSVRALSSTIVSHASTDAWQLTGTPLGVPAADTPFDGYIDGFPHANPNSRQLQASAYDVNQATGEVAILYTRAENPAATAGLSVTPINAAGGKSLRYFALSTMTQLGNNPGAITELLRQLVRLQAGEPMLCIALNHKGNDSNDTAPSYVLTSVTDHDTFTYVTGPPSNTPQGYAHNLRTVIRLLDAAWAANGYPPSNLLFLDAAYHPQFNEPHASGLPAFEAASRAVSDELSHPAYARLACVAGTRLTTHAEMLFHGCYRLGGFDTAHLTSAGYQFVERRQWQAILRAIDEGDDGHIRGLGFLPTGGFESRVLASNAAGTAACGENLFRDDVEPPPPPVTIAFRWSQTGGMQSLGFIGYGEPGAYSTARAMTAAGGVIVGSATDHAFVRRPFRWTQTTSLVDLSNGAFSGVANAVSTEGNWVAGTNTSANRAFVWNEISGLMDLGVAPGAQTSSAVGVSDDGQRVLALSGQKACLWRRGLGWMTIEQVLSLQGINTAGWDLNDPRSLSADGTVMTGNGTNPQGQTQGWVAVIPPDACGGLDFNGDGDASTDADIEAFFACLAGSCCPTCWLGTDINQDGDFATDADIEAFFSFLAGNC
jgi:uncharacterized membrane protein